MNIHNPNFKLQILLQNYQKLQIFWYTNQDYFLFIYCFWSTRGVQCMRCPNQNGSLLINEVWDNEVWINVARESKMLLGISLPKFSESSWTPPRNNRGGYTQYFRLKFFNNPNRTCKWTPPAITGGVQLDLLNFGKEKDKHIQNLARAFRAPNKFCTLSHKFEHIQLVQFTV